MTYYSFINGPIFKSRRDETIAIKTYLGGFILSGVFIDKNFNKESPINFNSAHVLCIAVEDNFINDYKEEKCVYQNELKGQLNKFWETEGVDLNDYIEDNKLIKRFSNELKFSRTRYFVKPPFREHHDILPDNFHNSKTELVQLLNKLKPDLLANYD